MIPLVMLGIAVLAVLWLVGLYNGLVRRRNQVKNAWAQIDVQLKRRYDLIPNLVETAKGYMTHERETLETIARARSGAVSAQASGNVAQIGQAEGQLAGGIGNFINGELWGRATEAAWGVRLPCSRFPEQCRDLPLGTEWSLALHPSQLYEAALEGLVLFLVLWIYSRRPRPTMAVSGLFLLGYGFFRGLVELVRVPDSHIGYLAFNWLTMGQLLSLPMILAGILLLILAYRRPVTA